jgi:ribose transport system substrate-binding protein
VIINQSVTSKEADMRLKSLGLAAVAIIVGFFLVTVSPVYAGEDLKLGAGLIPRPGSPKVPAGKYKKAPPWRIGFSLPGVGNSWIVQMMEETKHEVSKHKEIGEFIIVDAEWKPAKQVADLEDLLTKKPDLIIVAPVTPTSGAAAIDKIAARGIPVVISGMSAGTDAYAVNFITGGEPFGRVGGEFLVKALNGKGTVWMFRGPPGFAEDESRYQGAVKAFKGTDIKIGAEVHGMWGYAKAKQLCENLVLSGKPVDGIWFSGAEMTKGCLDVFKEFKKPLVPMTGEGNNGFLRVWKETGVKSIGAVFPATMGEAQIRTAVALLKGKEMYRDYYSVAEPITVKNIDAYYRPDLNDNYWVPSGLPEAKLQKLYGKKRK